MLFIKKYLWRRSFRKSRSLLRGFRNLKAENNLGIMRIIKQEFATAPLNLIKRSVRLLIFGAGLHQAEDIVRQYQYALVAALNFDNAFLATLGKFNGALVYPLPSPWRDIVRKKGFQVAELGSSILWNLLLLRELFKGIVAAYQIIFRSCKSNKNNLVGSYVYFEGLTVANLPKVSNQQPSYDIISWYAQWEGRKKVDCYVHNVTNGFSTEVNNIPVMPVRSALFPLNFKSLFCFVGWCIVAFWTALFDWLQGRWWHVLLFREAVKSKVIQLQAPEQLATEYLFHEYIYRPLWTYEAEKKGSKITLYFYATYTNPYKCFPHFRNLPMEPGLASMSWPRYLVWDCEQAEDMNKMGYDKEVEIVGPIWFVDNGKALPSIPQRTIAVFDGTAYRELIFSTLPVELVYYSVEIVNLFMEDIHYSALENRVHIVLKRKRDVGNLMHRKYQAQLNKLSFCPEWIHLESDISPKQLIKVCDAVISIPFTSTGVLANHMGKSSIYYDPLGIVRKDEREAHGVKVIGSRQELSAWMHSMINMTYEIKINPELEDCSLHKK